MLMMIKATNQLQSQNLDFIKKILMINLLDMSHYLILNVLFNFKIKKHYVNHSYSSKYCNNNL